MWKIANTMPSVVATIGPKIAPGPISDALLYAALVFGSFWIAIFGLGLSPLWWNPAKATSRHVGILGALLLSALAPRLFGVDNTVVDLQEHFGLLALSPWFALRPSTVAVLLLAVPGSRGGIQMAAGSLAAIVIECAGLQVLAANHATTEAVGYWLLGVVVLIELANAWFVWARPAVPAHNRLGWAALLLGLAVVFQTVTPSAAAPHASVRFWWPTAPLPDFRRAVDGYGWNQIGSIGELPALLQKAGYAVERRADFDDLRADAVVLPLPFRSLTEAEVTSLHSYVRRGGRLLIIGEHTNLDGIRDTTNSVTAAAGLQLNFDTTNGLFGDTTTTLVGPRVGDTPYLTHNRGASLRLQGWRVRPLLTGTWWHSDYGDPLAPDRAYLSDYRASGRDRVGNLVLAGTAAFGAGRITLWGDGSPFLNQNLAYNSRFVLGIFADLLGRRPLWWLPALAALLLLAAFIVTREPRIVWLIACVAVIAPHVWNKQPDLPAPLAIISTAENNMFSNDPFSGEGVTGLGVWLTRQGFVPWVGNWHDVQPAPRLLLVLNPAHRVDAAQLRRMASAGATIVVAGAGDNEHFLRVAESFGVSVQPPALGRLGGTEFTTYSAWRIATNQGTVIQASDVPVGTVLSIGTGRVLILADSGFFYSKNIETETGYDAVNQQFLKRLLVTR